MKNKPNEQQAPRERLQELLKIPESQRTDEQWDEIHELEISLAAAHIRASEHRLPAHGNKGSPSGQQPGQQPGRPRKKKRFKGEQKRHGKPR